MGRLKAFHNLNPLFSGKYKKLLEEYNSKDYSRLLPQDPMNDLLSYSCRHCGHIQTLQAEDLNSIVGHAFRLAYAAHLQKTGTAVRDVIPAHTHGLPTPRSHTLAYPHSHKHSRCPSAESKSSLPSSAHVHEDQSQCDSFCCAYAGDQSGVSCSRKLDSSSPASNKKELSSTAMRTPGSGTHLPHKTPPSLCLQFHGEGLNALQSPDSDTGNSPTDLNSTKGICRKPPLVKKLGVALDSFHGVNIAENQHSLVSSSSVGMHSCTSECTDLTNVCSFSNTTPVTSALTEGYVNDSSTSNSTSFSSNISIKDFDIKSHQNVPQKTRRVSSVSSTLSAAASHQLSSSSTRSVTPPPLPERSDSLTPQEEPHLTTAAWFQAGIPREIALEILGQEPVGAFMVRESTSKPGCYALSLRVPRDFTLSGIAHYLIVNTSKGYKIKGFTKEFHTLTALITHHSVMPELLPCPLSLSRYNPSFTKEDQDRNGDDPDYNTLSDFRKMMADLNV